MPKRAVLLIDRESLVPGDPDLTSPEAETHAGMEHAVGRALRELGYGVTIIPCRSGRQLATELTAARPDVVFNATEHMYGNPVGDVHVAAVLETLRLPYTGSSPAALLLCRDKGVTKSLASAVGVRVPPFAVVPVGIDTYEPPPLPAVVKPALRDSSVGIGVASFVRTQKALDARIALVHRRYRETAIVESFIPGVDVNVFTLQGKKLQVFPPTARRVSAADAASPHSMATFHVKHNAAYRERWQIRYEYADVNASAMRLLHRDIHRLWPVLQLRDYARFDYRLTDSGDLTLIEVNANPGFSPYSRSERWTWEEYLVAMKTVVENAMRRGG